VTDIDVALADRSRQGDREAFEELVRRTARALFAHLYLETADAHRAEDLSQETYLKAWRSIGSLSDPARFRPWLFSVAHSVLISDIRRRGRLKRQDDRTGDEIPDSLSSIGPSPPETLERRDERRRVLSALRSLPREYRLPLTLRYIAGADYETIGRELGVSNGSLRGMLHRGLGLLRKQLGEPEENEKSPRSKAVLKEA